MNQQAEDLLMNAPVGGDADAAARTAPARGRAEEDESVASRRRMRFGHFKEKPSR